MCILDWLSFVGIILHLALIIALHCFLVSLSIYFGLLACILSLSSYQCFVFYFCEASWWIISLNFSLFLRDWLQPIPRLSSITVFRLREARCMLVICAGSLPLRAWRSRDQSSPGVFHHSMAAGSMQSAPALSCCAHSNDSLFTVRKSCSV